MEDSRPGASASSLSSTPRQRQIKLRAAFSLGHPQPIGRCALAGRGNRPCFPHRPCFPPALFPTQAAGSFVATDQHEEALRSDAVHWLSEARSPSSAATAGPALLAVLRRLRALALQLELSPGGTAGTLTAN